jgi:ribosomal-protein-serine acetyltransferase
MLDIPVLRVDEEIVLEPIELRHAEAIFALVEVNRERLRTWLSWVDGSRSLNDTRQFIEKSRMQRWMQQSHDSVISYRGQVVGAIGLAYIDRANYATEIGYWLDGRWEGHGIMTRACRRLVSYCFGPLGLHRVQIRCALDNQRSRAIPQRLGFREEGRLRDAQWLYDRFVDLLIYGMLASEWHA